MNRQEVQSMSSKQFREVITKFVNERRWKDLKIICQWRSTISKKERYKNN